MKKRIRFIINPISGTGKQHRAEKLLRKLLDSTSDIEGELLTSSNAGHITHLAKEAANLNYHAVVVVGGDGSINEALQALVGTETALGIIPIGSGNGLARHLGISMHMKRAINKIKQFEIKKIDTAQLNNIHFVSIAGIGFDAHIARLFMESKKRGLWNYAKISFSAYFSYKSQNYQLTLDGKKIDTKAFMIVFANANQFGNNFVIAPQASVKDGFLDVCLIKRPKIHQFPDVLFKVFRKKIDRSKLVEIQQAQKVSLELKNPQWINVDGEARKETAHLQIAINPLSLRVIV